MNSKLSPETIEEIRNTPGKQSDVARRFGISQAQVSRIQSHKSWSNRIADIEAVLRYIVNDCPDLESARKIARHALTV